MSPAFRRPHCRPEAKNAKLLCHPNWKPGTSGNLKRPYQRFLYSTLLSEAFSVAVCCSLLIEVAFQIDNGNTFDTVYTGFRVFRV